MKDKGKLILLAILVWIIDFITTIICLSSIKTAYESNPIQAYIQQNFGFAVSFIFCVSFIYCFFSISFMLIKSINKKYIRRKGINTRFLGIQVILFCLLEGLIIINNLQVLL